jgi:Transglutaminase-like superfamily
MWEPLKRYSKLDSQARRIFWRATMLLPRVRIALRLRGYKKTQNWLERLGRGTSGFGLPVEREERIARTCRMVSAAARYGIGKSSCLDESLVLWRLLMEQGIPAALRIGVRKESGELAAHAWVEHQGAALNQKEEMHRHYSAFEREFGPPTGQP